MACCGAAMIAMVGKDCVALAADRRFGGNAQTVAMDFNKIHEMGPHLYLGLAGLATDIQTVSELLRFRLSLWELRENRRVKPRTFMSMVSNFLYERRFGPFLLDSLVAGLDPKTHQPFICHLDLLGCSNEKPDFVVGGSCKDQLYGMAEALWEPNMNPGELFECAAQCLLNAADRDAISGWGGIVYIIEKHQVTTRTLKGRMD